MGWYLDGRVSAVIGTHTHIPTADTTILPGGAAFQTDAGMAGPFFSVIGVLKEDVIRRFLTSIPERFEEASQDAQLTHAEGLVGLSVFWLRWPRLSEQFFRVDKWSLCRG